MGEKRKGGRISFYTIQFEGGGGEARKMQGIACPPKSTIGFITIGEERKERVERMYFTFKSFSSNGLHYVVSFISSSTTKQPEETRKSEEGKIIDDEKK